MWGWRREEHRRDEPPDEALRRFAAVWPQAIDPPADRVTWWRALDGDPVAGVRPVPRDVPSTEGVRSAAGGAGEDDGWASGFGNASGPVDPPTQSPPLAPAEPALSAAVLGAFSPGRRGVRALVGLAVVVVVVAGFLAWRARPQVDRVGPPASAAPVAVVSSPNTLVVAVQGKVHKPGLVTLPTGARVADALAAAGGVLPGTDLTGLNLARKLVDGELILVGQTPPAGSRNGAGIVGGGKVNINLAGPDELDTLPGIGPALAQRIITYRGQHGAFGSVDDLRKVPGIGDAKFAEIKDLVTV